MNLEEFLVVEMVRDEAPLLVRHEEFCMCEEGCEELASHPLRNCNLLDSGCYQLVRQVAIDCGVL